MTAPLRLLRWHEQDRDRFGRLTLALERVRRVAAAGRGDYVAVVPTGPEEPDDADRARALLAMRRARDAAAGPLADLFGEPGWDILLALFVAYEEGRAVTAATLGPATGVRPLVLVRWIDVLVARDLVRRGAAGDMLSLTDEGVALVLRCIGDV